MNGNSCYESEFESVDIDKTLSDSSEEEKAVEKSVNLAHPQNLNTSASNITKESGFQDSFSTTLYDRPPVAASTKRPVLSPRYFWLFPIFYSFRPPFRPKSFEEPFARESFLDDVCFFMLITLLALLVLIGGIFFVCLVNVAPIFAFYVEPLYLASRLRVESTFVWSFRICGMLLSLLPF